MFRVGERSPIGVEDVGVEQMRQIGDRLVSHPRDCPLVQDRVRVVVPRQRSRRRRKRPRMNNGESGKQQKDWPTARMGHVIGQTASGFGLSALVSHAASRRALYTKTVVWLNYAVMARARPPCGNPPHALNAVCGCQREPL